MSRRWYGSLDNRLLENTRGLDPQIGMGVTECLYSDREPYEIIAIKDDRHITVRRMNYKRVDDNGMSECQDYEYTSNPEGYTCELFKNKKGIWVRRVGTRGVDDSHGWYVGYAERYYDYSF